MYILDNSRPKLDYWGTPQKIGLGFFFEFPTKPVTHLNDVLLFPCFANKNVIMYGIEIFE